MAIALQAQCFDDKLVIIALREPGDGDRSDDAGAGERDGKRAAVACVVSRGKAVFLLEGSVARLESETDGIVLR